MLKRPVPGKKQWLAMVLLSAGLSAGVACAAWAAQPAKAEGVPAAAVEVRMPPPKYPQAAFAESKGGKVLLRVDVDASGTPTNVVVEKAEPAGYFEEATVAAARQWKFIPAYQDGKPVAGSVRVPVMFSMDEDSPEW